MIVTPAIGLVVEDRDLEDSKGNFRISRPEWTEPTHLRQHSYVDLETRLAEMDS